jgi:hypothetical protein
MGKVHGGDCRIIWLAAHYRRGWRRQLNRQDAKSAKSSHS